MGYENIYICQESKEDCIKDKPCIFHENINKCPYDCGEIKIKKINAYSVKGA